MEDIRKISVGMDYPNGVIHYQRGKYVKLNGIPYKISSIIIDSDRKELGKLTYNIYISNENGTVLWKRITDVPVIVENNIDFE